MKNDKKITSDATRTAKMEVGDLILALCEAGEWDLALRMAREVDGGREH